MDVAAGLSMRLDALEAAQGEGQGVASRAAWGVALASSVAVALAFAAISWALRRLSKKGTP